MSWIRSLLDRYPDLVIEGCSGGGGRSDFGIMSELQLVSTSDQENPLAYPAIAVGSLAHILPEQAGNWAYPQPAMTDHEIAFAMTVGLAGRLYLAGVLNEMSEHQLAIVRAGVQAHNATKQFIARAIPAFPLGFPDWNDAWVAVAFEGGPGSPNEQLLILWALPGASEQIEVPIRLAGDRVARIECVYPSEDVAPGWKAEPELGGLRLRRPDTLTASAVFRIVSEVTGDD